MRWRLPVPQLWIDRIEARCKNVPISPMKFVFLGLYDLPSIVFQYCTAPLISNYILPSPCLALSNIHLIISCSFSPLQPILPLPRFLQHSFHQGALVLSCTPCHPLISSPSTSLTNLCCFNILSPLNRSLTTSIPYILPQPPLISCTSSFVGFNSLCNMPQISFSFSFKWAGASIASCSRAASCSMPASPLPIVP